MIVGIDPGKTGGIVCLDNSGNFMESFIIPKIDGDVNMKAFANIFHHLAEHYSDVHVFVEDVHALYGSSAGATFSFGKICGQIEMGLYTCFLPHTYVQPKAWQKVMFGGIEEIRKPSKINKKGKEIKGRRDTKAMAELAYKKYFPDVDFYFTEKGNKSKNVRDGLVDAILIAEWGRRKINK